MTVTEARVLWIRKECLDLIRHGLSLPFGYALDYGGSLVGGRDYLADAHDSNLVDGDSELAVVRACCTDLGDFLDSGSAIPVPELAGPGELAGASVGGDSVESAEEYAGVDGTDDDFLSDEVAEDVF